MSQYMGGACGGNNNNNNNKNIEKKEEEESMLDQSLEPDNRIIPDTPVPVRRISELKRAEKNQKRDVGPAVVRDACAKFVDKGLRQAFDDYEKMVVIFFNTEAVDLLREFLRRTCDEIDQPNIESLKVAMEKALRHVCEKEKEKSITAGLSDKEEKNKKMQKQQVEQGQRTKNKEGVEQGEHKL